LSLDDTRRIGAWANGARLSVSCVTVRVRTAAEPVTLHDPLKAASLRGPLHFYHLARGEHVHLHGIADVVGRDLDLRVPRLVESEAAQHARRVVEARLFRMAQLRLVRATSTRCATAVAAFAGGALPFEAELHGREASRRLVRHGEHRIRL